MREPPIRARRGNARATGPQRSRRTALAAMTVAAGLALAACTATAQQVPLHPDDPTLRRVGDLVYRGGLALPADTTRFGGLSAIEVSADGASLTAVSDIGDWFVLALTYDQSGDLAGAAVAAAGRLAGPDGAPLRGKRATDAEGLARGADGARIVSFERDHRLLAYPAATPPFSVRSRTLATPPGLADAPGNGGAEAITELADGRLLVIAEDLAVDGPGVGAAWRGDGRRWERLGYRLAPSFKPTGAALLPDGDVLVVERSVSIFGFGARIVRLAGADIAAGGTIAGRELARLQPPLIVDNVEAVSARRGPDGETLLYLVSDNNFNVLQRTLLLMFALAP